MKLDGRSVLLSGGGSGIGRELALALAKRGARLVLTGRRVAPLEETARLVEEAGGEARVVAGDVSDAGHRQAALDQAASAFGGLEVLINNAGNTAAGRLENISEADIRAMIEVNLLAPILFTRAALPLLRQSGGAMVVNVSSGFGLIGFPFYTVYCAAKGGLSMFGEALRRELMGEGVHVLTAYPAATDTPMMATSGIGPKTGVTLESPQSVAAAIVKGMENDALSVIFGGEPREAMIRTNQTEPERIDETLAGRKPVLEPAVEKHRAM